MPKVSKTGAFRKTAAEEARKKKTEAAAINPTSNSIDQNAVSKLVKKKADNENDDVDGNNDLSRGQRKRLAKQKQYQRKQELIMSSLKLKKEEEQKKRIDGLDAIKDALLTTVSTNSVEKNKSKEGEEPQNQQTSLLKTNKTRLLLVQKEEAQMSLVMQHPSFRADPFATIREHLQNTLATPDVVAAQKKQEALHIKDRKQKEEAKKAVKKEQQSRHKRKQHRARPTRSRAK